jgi:hypothetical protein
MMDMEDTEQVEQTLRCTRQASSLVPIQYLNKTFMKDALLWPLISTHPAGYSRQARADQAQVQAQVLFKVQA